MDKKDPSGADAMDKALHEKDYHQIDWNSLSQDAEGAHKNAEQLKQEVIKNCIRKRKSDNINAWYLWKRGNCKSVARNN